MIFLQKSLQQKITSIFVFGGCSLRKVLNDYLISLKIQQGTLPPRSFPPSIFVQNAFSKKITLLYVFYITFATIPYLEKSDFSKKNHPFCSQKGIFRHYYHFNRILCRICCLSPILKNFVLFQKNPIFFSLKDHIFERFQESLLFHLHCASN